MNYQETLDWMFAQLPMYQKQGKAAFKKDLTNSKAFAKELDFPEQKIKTIHVGGTNGKGSTSHMIASVLQEAGYRVGLYTSPHLKSFTERIRINGSPVDEQFVIDFIAQQRGFIEQQALSFFEMTVGMAFAYFASEEVDIAVIEVGLGGRLDSTNIISPEVSVITNIGLDHTQFLGETFEAIAFEKAGIIKAGVPVVIGEYQAQVASVFQEIAATRAAEIIFASEGKADFKTDLLGDYQQHNSRTAVAAIGQLKSLVVSDDHIKQGLLRVVENTHLQGRWQVLQQCPKVVCDTAHNKEGLLLVMRQLQKEQYAQLHVVLGVVSDKDLDTILPLFPKDANYYFCAPQIPRAMNVSELQAAAQRYDLHGDTFGSVNQATTNAKANAVGGDLIYIGGSTFVVAEII